MIYDTLNDAVTLQGGVDTLLAGRYRVLRQLGQGGMGSVWLVEDTKLDNKLFAVKMLPSILVSNKRAYKQLKEEALVSLNLTHPNIVNLRAFEENNGNPFLVMDYIEGRTLDDYLAEKGTLTEEETLCLLKPIAAALDYAHGEGVVHRDIKPGNVMIRKDGRPFILDFGIAREMQETMTRVTGKLSSGTLLYMSPEQLNGDAPSTAQDVYSFAAMVYECIKGEPPFCRGQIEYQICNKAPSPLGTSRLCQIVMRALGKMPEERPTSCLMALVEDGFSSLPGVRQSFNGSKSGPAPTDGRSHIAADVVHEAGIAELLRLRIDIKLKIDEVQGKMSRIAKYRGETYDSFAIHLKNADSAWRIIEAVDKTPKSIDEAIAVNAIIDDADKSIASELEWFEANKNAKDDAIGINLLIENDLLRQIGQFGPDTSDPESLAAGRQHRDEALALIKIGDFLEAKNRLVEAKRELQSVVEHTKSIYIDAHLGLAQEYIEENRFDESIEQANLVLGWDASNENASRLKQEALSLKVPSLMIEALIDGESIDDARIENAVADGRSWPTPCIFTDLTNDFTIGPFKVTCSRGQNIFYGYFPKTRIDWQGRKVHPIELGLLESGHECKLLLPGGVVIDMVYCPPGEFEMGSPYTEKGRYANEVSHGVRLTKGFWIGKYAITQEQWQSVMGNNPSRWIGMDLPVESVSWVDCKRFVNTLNNMLECGARMPTESEWEYACRAGNNGPYSGDLEREGWYWGNSEQTTHPIGQKSANAWGIHDMHGNVWEWCQDWYGDYPSRDVVDPSGAPRGKRRILRGGGWSSNSRRCRAAFRGSQIPICRVSDFGFRLCCDSIKM